jgi:hypothetical protein
MVALDSPSSAHSWQILDTSPSLPPSGGEEGGVLVELKAAWNSGTERCSRWCRTAGRWSRWPDGVGVSRRSEDDRIARKGSAPQTRPGGRTRKKVVRRLGSIRLSCSEVPHYAEVEP